MGENHLRTLQSYNQNLWLDFIRRGMLMSDELQRLIDDDGISGMTSNLSILDKAIAGSHDYDEAIQSLIRQGHNAREIYESLVVEDCRMAADLCLPHHMKTGYHDGFVSLEIPPTLAHDTNGMIDEARRLWKAVDRPNILIKIPATREGLPVIRQLISDGINVNITLLFGLSRYRTVVEAYLDGLEERNTQGKSLEHITSVASFFLSRIDGMVDPLLESRMRQGSLSSELASSLYGQSAVACAKITYQRYTEYFQSERFLQLAHQGARTQRLLWASTSTKNPIYSDVKYIDALIGPDTISAIPIETLNAYRDHGDPSSRLQEEMSNSMAVLEGLSELDIDMSTVAQQLEDEGIDRSLETYTQLMRVLEETRKSTVADTGNILTFDLGTGEADMQDRIRLLASEQFPSRLWHKDPTLWRAIPEEFSCVSHGLGWLHVAEKMQRHRNQIAAFVEDIHTNGFQHIVLIGMGDSSLPSLIFQRISQPGPNGVLFDVLDTTDPVTVLLVKEKAPLGKTLFLVVSKSGSTVETLTLCDYFYDEMTQIKGSAAGENFVAITDPGTPLTTLAQKRHFRRVFLNYPDISGRYSALSFFGLIPAALMGIDDPAGDNEQRGDRAHRRREVREVRR